jgi:hypothetical protein
MLAVVLAELYVRYDPPPAVYEATRNIVQRTHSEPSPNPMLGYLPRANFTGRFSNREFDTTVQINSQHMRDKEYSQQKAKGVKRIVAVGDSFLFGWGVEGDETLTDVLATEYLNHVEVLNMGVSGYCDSQKLERLKTEGFRFSPDVVLFEFYNYPSSCRPDVYFDRGTMSYRPMRTDLRRFASAIKSSLYLYWLFRQPLDAAERTIGVLPPPASPLTEASVFAEERKLLLALRKLLSEANVNVVFLYVPTKAELFDKSDPVLSESKRILREFSEKERWLFIDTLAPLQEVMRSERRNPYFTYDDHWNRDGHRTAARTIATYLRTHAIFTPEYFSTTNPVRRATTLKIR